MEDFPQCFKSSRQDSFPAKLRNIGKPNQIRLKLEITGLDTEDIKWHLDHVNTFEKQKKNILLYFLLFQIVMIDPETQAHYKFPCKQWIRPSEEKLLNYSDSIRKGSSSTNSSKSSYRKKQPAIIEQKPKVSSRSSSSSYESPKRFELIKKPIINPPRRISTDNESNDQNKVHYRIIIYPSNEPDGEFNASNESRIFLRINNQTKDSVLYKKDSKYCPTFESGESQSFEIDLRQNINEQPMKLTVGYYNTDITAGKWKLQKVIY